MRHLENRNGAMLARFSQDENILVHNGNRLFDHEARVIGSSREKRFESGPRPGMKVNIEFLPAGDVTVRLPLDFRFGVVLARELGMDMPQMFLVGLPTGALASVRVIEQR